MTHGKGRYRLRRNRTRVRDLFWHEWDPIGVNELGGSISKYDTYADRAYVMLMQEGCSVGEIADYLYQVSTEGLGLRKSARLRELADVVAGKLDALKLILRDESDEPF